MRNLAAAAAQDRITLPAKEQPQYILASPPGSTESAKEFNTRINEAADKCKQVNKPMVGIISIKLRREWFPKSQ